MLTVASGVETADQLGRSVDVTPTAPQSDSASEGCRRSDRRRIDSASGALVNDLVTDDDRGGNTGTYNAFRSLGFGVGSIGAVLAAVGAVLVQSQVAAVGTPDRSAPLPTPSAD